MRIGLYAQVQGLALGGADVCVAVLADALAGSHDVEIVHHAQAVTIDRLAEFTGTNLSRVRLRRVAPPAEEEGSDSFNLLRRYRQAREAGRHLSAGYDLFVAFVHDPPPFCHARRGVLLVLFPMFVPYHRVPRHGSRANVWDRARRAYASVEWRKRVSRYTIVAAISEYTRDWVRRFWGVDAKVVYPPVGVDVAPAPKSPLLISVGRFASGGHVKCQLEMVGAFGGLNLSGWRYVSAGTLGCSPADQAYAARVCEAAAGKPITIATNLERAALRDLYGHARIFWHAAGLTNVSGAPEQNEHFGLSTVEAMAAGCVPVVINKGGQPEIVQHGKSGFLWNTVDELRRYTETLAHDEALWSRMSEAAVERARLFDRAHYVDRFLRLIGDDSA
jgi:glycosyltransferase involved in cell wall biosynthesis